MTRRKEFSKALKARRFEHCGGKCEMCGTKLRPAQFDYHHVREAALLGDNLWENCLVVCKSCHKVLTKTRAPILAKVKRVYEKHVGIKKSTGWNKKLKKGVNGVVRDRVTGEPV